MKKFIFKPCTIARFFYNFANNVIIEIEINGNQKFSQYQ